MSKQEPVELPPELTDEDEAILDAVHLRVSQRLAGQTADDANKTPVED